MDTNTQNQQIQIETISDLELADLLVKQLELSSQTSQNIILLRAELERRKALVAKNG